MGGVEDIGIRGNHEWRIHTNAILPFIIQLLTHRIQWTYKRNEIWGFLGQYGILIYEILLFIIQHPSISSYLIPQFSINIKEFAQFVKLVDEMSCNDEEEENEEEHQVEVQVEVDDIGEEDGLFLPFWIYSYYEMWNIDILSSPYSYQSL